MKEITQYQCECCGTCYKDAGACQVCENSHVRVDSVLQYKYNSRGMGPESKYPHAIIVRMEDGKDLTFKR